MNLCATCIYRHRPSTSTNERCTANAPQAVLLEAGRNVRTCPTFRRRGDGAQLLVDNDGAFKNRS